jgi:hypothetical protein
MNLAARGYFVDAVVAVESILEELVAIPFFP